MAVDLLDRHPHRAGFHCLIAHFLHENKVHKNHRVDWLGAATMLITGTVIVFGLLQGGQGWPWLSFTTLGFVLVSILLVAVTMRIERRAEEPILPRWVWVSGCW